MKIRSAEFTSSAPDLPFCPPALLPEFAVIGRSNVGKSSVINLLTERRDLAKVSGTPGKTRLINFFAINGTWSLVDLPGYGYAKVAQEKRADFNEAVANYLEGRPTLAGMFVLVDARVPPQTIDLDFIEWVQTCPAPYALVFTKVDKVTAGALRESTDRFLEALAARRVGAPPVLACSAHTKVGRGDLLRHIEAAIAR